MKKAENQEGRGKHRTSNPESLYIIHPFRPATQKFSFHRPHKLYSRYPDDQLTQLALVNATVGAQLADKVNIKEAAGQWRLHRDEFFVKYRTLYATHPHLLARLDHLNEAATELRIG